MKRIFYFIAISFFLIQCNPQIENDGITIQGEIKNSTTDYIIFSHEPQSGGNLNFDNFKSISAKIDTNGFFKIKSDHIINNGNYSINIGDKTFRIVLSEGDNIQFLYDFNNKENSPFYIGKGAGKNNVLSLPQFILRINPRQFSNLSDFKSFSDSLINSENKILNAIYQQDISNIALKGLENRKTIERIISETPLTESEYNFLHHHIGLLKYSIGRLSSYFCRFPFNDTLKIDFDGREFEEFNTTNYQQIGYLGYNGTDQVINSIVLIEYLRLKQNQNNQLVCSDWKYYWQDTLYSNFEKSFLKNNFPQEYYDYYYANEISDAMLMGRLEEDTYTEFISKTTPNKYTRRLISFHDLISNGLSDSVYNLGSDEKELNSHKLDSLFESKNDKPIYVIFWSVKYAGSSIIQLLPAIKQFESDYENQIHVLNICIDEKKNKNLWAARIIDNEWKSDHYFIDKDEKDSTIQKFDIEKIYSFCRGGATYSIIDLNGNIKNEVKAPWILTADEIKELVNVTVR